MRSALIDQLQAALGTSYTLDRAFGGGGMSRVFVARERALGRDLVVKALDELRDSLHLSLGAAYTLERDVGGATMNHTVP